MIFEEYNLINSIIVILLIIIIINCTSYSCCSINSNNFFDLFSCSSCKLNLEFGASKNNWLKKSNPSNI